MADAAAGDKDARLIAVFDMLVERMHALEAKVDSALCALQHAPDLAPAGLVSVAAITGAMGVVTKDYDGISGGLVYATTVMADPLPHQLFAAWARGERPGLDAVLAEKWGGRRALERVRAFAAGDPGTAQWDDPAALGVPGATCKTMVDEVLGTAVKAAHPRVVAFVACLHAHEYGVFVEARFMHEVVAALTASLAALGVKLPQSVHATMVPCSWREVFLAVLADDMPRLHREWYALGASLRRCDAGREAALLGVHRPISVVDGALCVYGADAELYRMGPDGEPTGRRIRA